MEKERNFQVDDEVEWIDDSFNKFGKRYTVINTDAKHAWLNDGCGGHYFSHFKLITKRPHPVGTIFSVLNEKEAEQYIGKLAEYSDVPGIRKGKWYGPSKLKNIGTRNDGFRIGACGSYHPFIRLCEESFAPTEPKVDPKLIEALKKSVQQWQIMYDTDKSKVEVYKFLGGSTDMSCFLCNFVGVHGGGNRFDCKRCIDWKAAFCHSSNTSPFRDYRGDDSSKPAQLKVLNHLKSELTRLEFESK